MPRKVFFSFHFDRDAWRVGQVRNANVVTSKYEEPKFLDKAQWEQIQRQGYNSIKNWIDTQMLGTSVTIVLIGAETSLRPWVEYEIKQSWNRGNALLGVYIHNIKDQYGYTDSMGANPFAKPILGLNGILSYDRLSYHVKTYDWVNDYGRLYIDDWIEAAARSRGK